MININKSPTTESTGAQSPAITGDNAKVSYGLSEEGVHKIVTTLTDKHRLEAQAKDEQIKALTQAVTAISQGKGVLGSEAQLTEAITALKQGDTSYAKALFSHVADKAEQEAKKGAEALCNLGVLAFLDNTQEALSAYRRATQLDADNAIGWNRLGHLLRRIGELDEAIIAYEKVLTLGEALGRKAGMAADYGNLGIVYKTRGELDKA
ncbi:MAG: tetratricopeptide repeat protein, partial [Methylococcales bacterium]|nr:tetratricopeptide repeat protein [Methylococcales bacterium]